MLWWVLLLAAYVVLRRAWPDRDGGPRRGKRAAPLVSARELPLWLYVRLLGTEGQRRRLAWILGLRRDRLTAPPPAVPGGLKRPPAGAVHLGPSAPPLVRDRMLARGYRLEPHIAGHPVGVPCAPCRRAELLLASVGHMLARRAARDVAASFSVPPAQLGPPPPGFERCRAARFDWRDSL